MIIVVEGISAAGKTTWCKSHAGSYLIPETFPADRKSRTETGLASAEYWTSWNVKRWADALSMERAMGHAVCDTDPFKLHYLWCLCQVGVAPKAQWELQLQATREAFLEKRLGFADAYFVKIIDPVVAKHQSDADGTRVRDRFDFHVQLQPALIRWYTLLSDALGVRMRWSLPDDGLHFDRFSVNESRYDIGLFDAFVSSLETNAI